MRTYIKNILPIFGLFSTVLLSSCDPDDETMNLCLDEIVLSTSDFYFTGNNGEKGAEGTFSNVYLTGSAIIFEQGTAGSNSVEASINIDLETLISGGNQTINLSLYEGKIRNIGDATYSTFYSPVSSSTVVGGFLTLTYVNMDCEIISGNYEINGGRFSSSLNRDLRLGIKGSFNSIGSN